MNIDSLNMDQTIPLSSVSLNSRMGQFYSKQTPKKRNDDDNLLYFEIEFKNIDKIENLSK